VLAVVLAMGTVGAWASDPFIKPTPEELAMKELPGFPNAPAVVLSREELTIDDLHLVRHHDRIKVLTEEGKKYANVELHYVSLSDYGDNEFTDDKKLGEISGRTIHPDGTIIPFMGKPYVKTLESSKHVKYQAKVFTLPDVEVGSIIEYSYSTRYDDHAYEPPDWFIQGELYLKSAHYEWYPTTQELYDPKKGPINSISWYLLLPPGAKIERVEKMNPGPLGGRTHTYALDVKDVPPIIEEELEPPVKSYSYRVLFNFTAYKSPEEFWKSEGKDWSKRVDSFAEPNASLKDATAAAIAGAATPEEKLRKIYAKVMELENTRYTRERDKREDKAQGEKIKTAADILKLQRGSPYQLTELFLGMARAAGFKAYAMFVPDRSIELCTPTWLSFQQFDDLVAVVVVDGKEVFFDPGSRYMPYGHLAWQHSFVRGLRQTEGGTEFSQTAGDSYMDNRTIRIANLNMDEKGEVTGKIDITYMGTRAPGWRHSALSGDEESLHHSLEKSMTDELPKSLEVKVGLIENLNDYEKPLKVNYTVTGTLGTVTGKRLLMPADLFTAGDSATFPHEKREQPVYFEYPQAVQDGLRVNFKKGFALEATPVADKYKFMDMEAYDLNVIADATGFTTHRNHVQSEAIVYTKDYAPLRQFYSQFESKDKESVVLKMVPVETASGSN
jgi:transglutaminase-like putative cysteine protease